jgi:16S rRNA (cytosine967-C5)-methyltransferase
MNSRLIVAHVIESLDKRPWDLQNILDHELSFLPVDHRDRRFIFEMVNGIVRNRLTLDYVIDKYLTDNTLVKNKQLRRIIAIGIYQILYMDKVPDHAAVNETVNCAHQDSRIRSMSGIVNGVLRSVIRDKKKALVVDPSKSLIERLSIEYSHPQWMVTRWLDRLGLARTRQLLAFNNERPDIFLRRKIRGISRQQFEAEMRDMCVAFPAYQNLYYRLEKQIIPDAIQLFKDGLCTVQAPSSGWIVGLLDVQKDDRCIDICSAPGGKTALIAELCGEESQVYACEVRPNRMELVQDTLRRMNLPSVTLVLCDGTDLPFRRKFNKVLLDAPCSSSGVLQRHPEGRWVKTSEDIGRLSELQEKLLNSAATLVITGGCMVYSTCSLEPEENEQRIEAFLSSHPDFVLDSVPSAVHAKFVDRSGYVRITPYDHKMDGMFGARLRRIAD